MRSRLPCRAIGVFLATCCACSTRGERARASNASPASAARLDSLLKAADALYFEASDSAGKLWRIALPVTDSLGDVAGRVRILIGLGRVAWQNSEYDDA